MSKVGRPAKHYIADNDEQIYGLSRMTDGRWRCIDDGYRFSAPNEVEAIRIFRQRQAKKRATFLSIPSKVINGRDADVGDLSEYIHHPHIQTSEPVYTAEQVRDLLLNTPASAAQLFGVPDVIRLASLPEVGPDVSLANILKIYVERKDKQLTEKEISETKVRFNQFIEIIGVASIREIKQVHIKKYFDWAYETSDAKGYSQVWRAHRFAKIKSIFNFAAKQGQAQADCQRVLIYCKMLSPGKKKHVDPHPISRANFHKLYDAADEFGKAMLLVCLNCCMYGDEAGTIHLEDIDFEKKTFAHRRGKTGIARIAVLWDRTIEAIEKMLEVSPRNDRKSGPLFLTPSQGNRLNGNIARDVFRDLRTATGISKTVKMADIRDGAYTAAASSGVNLDHCRMLAGHKVAGQTDAYVLRNAKIVGDACAAIEKEYFS